MKSWLALGRVGSADVPDVCAGGPADVPEIDRLYGAVGWGRLGSLVRRDRLLVARIGRRRLAGSLLYWLYEPDEPVFTSSAVPYRQQRRLYVKELVVDKAWQRHGLGSQLMASAARAAEQEGAGWLHVQPSARLGSSGSDRLVAFYARCGMSACSPAGSQLEMAATPAEVLAARDRWCSRLTSD
jgi:GNAT superfamily N-acetyltransferase